MHPPLRRSLALAAFSLTAAPALAGGPVPNGAAFSLSTCAQCPSSRPRLAALANGGFLALWQMTNGGALPGVWRRFFNFKGNPTGGPVQVVQTPLPSQYDGDVAVNAAGSMVAVWSTLANRTTDVWAQRFNSRGQPLGAAIQVSDNTVDGPTPPDDVLPSVAVAKDGSFTVAWIRDVPPLEPQAVWARRFGPTGTALGPELQVSSGLVAAVRPSLCTDSLGRTVAAWTNVDTSDPFEQSSFGVSRRHILPTGGFLPPTAEAVAVPPLARLSTYPALNCGATGGTFAMVWQSDQPPAAGRTDILLQRFTQLGRAIGVPRLVNLVTDQDQVYPAITQDSAGSLVIVWYNGKSGAESVSGRRFTRTGAPLDATEFVVATQATDGAALFPPAVAAAGPGGAFTVLWTNAGGAAGRRFKISP